MKKLLLLNVLLFMALILAAQAPKGLNYQSIVRDQTGKPLVNRSVNFRFSILKGSASGTVVFSEEQRTVTNEFGLTNVLLGYGFPLQGRFDQIDWSDGNYYLKSELDPNGGSNFELSSVTPFLSVPYALYSEKTKLEAGPGIQVDGNRITNTGDPDPTDDLKLGSVVSGDLSGTLPAPRVAGIQGRPVQDVTPAMQQALMWNGSQWVPGSVDADPANDLTMGSAASGDLSGSFPNPKVVKLNGFPMATTTPDSGDVLVFSQGEWKHFPVGSSPSASPWKRVGNDVLLDDPSSSVQRVMTQNASVFTQNNLVAAKAADSVQLSPLGIHLHKLIGTEKAFAMMSPVTYQLFSDNKLLMGWNAFNVGYPYAEMEFWNYDPGDRAVKSYFNPYEIHFTMDQPERNAHLYADEFELFRKTKDSPLEYAGLTMRDSFLYFYNGNKYVLGMDNIRNSGGGMFTYDKDGKDRIYISFLEADQSQPYIGLFSTKVNHEVAELLGYNSAGEMFLYNGNTGRLNVYAGYSGAGVAYPFISVVGANNEDYAGMYINTANQGIVFGDIKSFRMQDPVEADQEIWYACVEGPEAAAYERGSANLVNGEAFVPYSDHFKKVANTQTVTIQLTPGFADTYGVAVVEKTATGFRVKELQNRTGNFTFDWEVKAVRSGFEDYEVYHKKETLRADHATKRQAVGPHSEKNVQTRSTNAKK